MHLVPSSLYLPVTLVANASTTRSAGIGQVPALAPLLFFASPLPLRANQIPPFGESALGKLETGACDDVRGEACACR